MNEQRQETYLNLIQDLLNVQDSKDFEFEFDILNTNRELLDSALVEMMNQSAAIMAEKTIKKLLKKCYISRPL